MLLTFTIQNSLHVHQMDVVTAFLNGHLDKDIYMEPPEGFVKPGEEHLVCKLKKSMYGLKQSPHYWSKTFTVHEEHWFQTEYIGPMCVHEIATRAGDIGCIY